MHPKNPADLALLRFNLAAVEEKLVESTQALFDIVDRFFPDGVDDPATAEAVENLREHQNRLVAKCAERRERMPSA
jgi:hypothetical protein